MMKLIAKFDTALEYVESTMIVVALSIMVLLAFLQVLLRNFFETGILWGDILLRHLVLWVGFFGASLAARQDKHINVLILPKLLPDRFIPYMKIVVNIFAIVVTIILARASWIFLGFEKEAGTIIFLDIPSWYIQSILPLGFGLMAIRFFLKILEQITSITATKRKAN